MIDPTNNKVIEIFKSKEDALRFLGKKKSGTHITKSIKIPEFGNAESLNASIANAIIISEWKRQHYGRK